MWSATDTVMAASSQGLLQGGRLSRLQFSVGGEGWVGERVGERVSGWVGCGMGGRVCGRVSSWISLCVVWWVGGMGWVHGLAPPVGLHVGFGRSCAS